jgi:ubiquinone/menaquinone biosynthesis C-methylase UbiE
MLGPLVRLIDPPIAPADHLARCFRGLGKPEDAALRASIAAYLASRRGAAYLESAEGRRDLDGQWRRRLDRDRRELIPWLDAARPLFGSRILEIGCGTGCSSVALAEQGAAVTAVDIDAESIDLAQARCELHGVGVEFVIANANEIAAKLADEHFDLVIFAASLEHMTHRERLDAMSGVWRMLAPGSLWCVTDTPNRLWFFDDHTSRLPFYMWLPDDLAFAYARFSPRSGFREVYDDWDEDAALHFLRRGRGVSYHEFDLALGPSAELRVVSCLRLFLRERRRLHRLRAWRHRREPQWRYPELLASLRPDLHPGFFQPSLDLVIEKR